MSKTKKCTCKPRVSSTGKADLWPISIAGNCTACKGKRVKGQCGHVA